MTENSENTINEVDLLSQVSNYIFFCLIGKHIINLSLVKCCRICENEDVCVISWGNHGNRRNHRKSNLFTIYQQNDMTQAVQDGYCMGSNFLYITAPYSKSDNILQDEEWQLQQSGNLTLFEGNALNSAPQDGTNTESTSRTSINLPEDVRISSSLVSTQITGVWRQILNLQVFSIINLIYTKTRHEIHELTQNSQTVRYKNQHTIVTQWDTGTNTP